MEKVKQFKDRFKRILQNNPTASSSQLTIRLEELYTKMLEEEIARKGKEKRHVD